jgi:hypothetical protein
VHRPSPLGAVSLLRLSDMARRTVRRGHHESPRSFRAVADCFGCFTPLTARPATSETTHSLVSRVLGGPRFGERSSPWNMTRCRTAPTRSPGQPRRSEYVGLRAHSTSSPSSRRFFSRGTYRTRTFLWTGLPGRQPRSTTAHPRRGPSCSVQQVSTCSTEADTLGSEPKSPRLRGELPRDAYDAQSAVRLNEDT